MKLISFIIIGRNQARTIYDCINSIYSLIEEIHLDDSEVIFVDSSSTDRTVEIITDNFKADKIIRINGDMSVAIARNIGAKHATGRYLFFIDGDMTLDPSFIKHIYNESDGFLYDFVSGELEEIFYNDEWEQVGYLEKRYGVSKNKKTINELGGIFIIKTDLFRMVNGFKDYLCSNEDHDLEIRLAKKKVFFSRLQYKIATHYSKTRFTYKALFQGFMKKYFLCFGVTYRENFFNSYCIKRFLYMQKYTMVLIVACLLSIFIHPLLISTYFVFSFLRNFNKKRSNTSIIRFMIGRFVLDISLIFGFIFYYPCLSKRKYTDAIL